ncbi:OmpA family protein [Spongiivirga citrea]|uniref:OmpA family protein n=1 Tax=Spongiivirga citrea TaxID=1481457 RepID=A0A6M0CPX0_9FLAO|nr:OmpA family protein [Spongiivirga citrea]NER17547.1 OmpA family protein [Spongiivirga citrea]
MKKIVTYIKIFIPIFSIQAFSQNLVLNPSFENTKRCTELISNFSHNVTNWSTPTFGTTDLFNSCEKGTVGIPYNYNGMQKPKAGKNYAGFYLHSDENYREYVQVKLSKKLEKDKKYRISFYISLAEKSDFAIKNIDFMLTENELKTTIWRELSERQLMKQDIKDFSFHKIENNRFYDNDSDWTLISKDFIANGNEQFLTIGNFIKNSKTDKILVSNMNRYNMSYYYIDLVSIERTDLPKTLVKKSNKLNEEPTKELELKEITLNKNHTFKNVVFNFNSTKLSASAKLEINSLYKFLKQNLDTEISIAGHTDNVGTIEFNQKLSEKRAKSVADYFIFLGLEKSRISANGYGDTNPISTNETDGGRNKNRRVSFRIVKK